MGDKTKTLAQRVAAIQIKLGSSTVLTDQIGGRGNTYPSLRQALDTVLNIALDEGVTITQPIRTADDGRTFVSTILRDSESGETEVSELPIDTSATPQAVGSQITYYRRFTLLSVLSLAPGGAVEDDAEAAEVVSEERQRKRAAIKRQLERQQLKWSDVATQLGMDPSKVPSDDENDRILDSLSRTVAQRKAGGLTLKPVSDNREAKNG
jgi:hypothetical protein